MVSVCIRRLVGMGLAVGAATALATPAQAQVLDWLRGRDSREPAIERRVERSYPLQGEVIERDDRDGEFRGGSARYREEYRDSERHDARASRGARRGTTLIGSSVRLEDGRSFGRVEDIVIGDGGCVEFLVVTGLRGMSGKLAILPYDLGEADFSRRVVMIDWTEEDLRQAPIFFSANAWPDFTDSHWTGDVYAYFDIEMRDEHVGRAYREPRDMERGRLDDRSSRPSRGDREEFNRDSRDRRSDSQSDNRARESTHDRDSRSRSRASDRDSDAKNREESGSRSSRSREMNRDSEAQDRDESGNRSSQRSQSRSSDRNRSQRDQDNPESDDDGESKSSQSGKRRDSSNDENQSRSSNLPD